MIEVLNIKNGSIRYFKFGTGKKIMVMIPGLSIKSVMEQENLVKDAYKVFNNEYTVYCFDRIDNPKSNYYIKDMADDLVEAINKLNLKGLYLFGTSQGGMIALYIAINYPSIYKKIAVASTTANFEKYTKDIHNWIDLAKKGLKEELMLEFAKTIYTENIYNKFKDLCLDMAKDITDEELKKFIIIASGTDNFNVISDLYKIDKPIFLIGDKTDKLFGIEPIKEIIDHLKTNLYKSYIYNGYGHAPYDFAPDFKERLKEFFNE